MDNKKQHLTSHSQGPLQSSSGPRPNPKCKVRWTEKNSDIHSHSELRQLFYTTT